jgi:hypothetical protein
MAYDLTGDFYEACDCEVICSCWAGVDPDMGVCTGLFAWRITSGLAGGVDLAGCKLMLLNSGRSCDQSEHMLVMLDANGDPARTAALRQAFISGPWSQIVPLPVAGQHEFIEAQITIGATTFSAAAAPWLGAAARDLVVGVNHTLKPVALVSHQAGDLIDRALGSTALTREVQVGVAAAVAGALPNTPGADGLNLLADVNPGGATPYTFDLDIDRVTAMRGPFRYVLP